jgi:anti-sigma regulatory factor (Ser/Thr protein kinase)
MGVRETVAVDVKDGSQVAAARRTATELARALVFDETLRGRVALAVTEAATNLIKHGGGGEVLLSPIDAGTHRALEIVALDHGPGMASVDRCLEDGYSTAGSPGTGLGAVRRLASAFDVYSKPGAGTALVARVAAGVPRPSPAGVVIRGLSVAYQGEDVCGDAWDWEPHTRGGSMLVVDGLGHGLAAAQAAREAVETFRAQPGMPPAARVESLHLALRATRGAALAVAHIDLVARIVRFAGLGNISAIVYGGAGARRLVSQHGTAGVAARRVEEYTCPWPPHGVLVMHSDGLATIRGTDAYPGLLARDPGVVAGVLYRDHTRRRDDATVVVAREDAA